MKNSFPNRKARLSRISTMWTMLGRAHGDNTNERHMAQSDLFERYSSSIQAYLARLLRNTGKAEDAFQDFAVKFLSGSFRNADPQRGRFRDYLKTAVIRFSIDVRRKQSNRKTPLVMEELADAEQSLCDNEFENDFVEVWRNELLENTWEALAQSDRSSGQSLYEALQLRSRHPDWNSLEIADGLTRRIRPEVPFNTVQLRKILQRARNRFAILLIDEVATSLQVTSFDRIEQELIDLGLYEYCKSRLPQRRADAK